MGGVGYCACNNLGAGEVMKKQMGLKLRIELDECAEKPEFSVHIGHWSAARTALGTDAMSPEELRNTELDCIEGRIIGLPVWAYQHGNVMMRAAADKPGYPFDCPWDAGQSGVAWVTFAEARRVLGVKRMTDKRVGEMLEIVKSEVETFAAWVNGECWRYVVEDDKGVEVDSCGGYWNREYCEEAGKDALDAATPDEFRGFVCEQAKDAEILVTV